MILISYISVLKTRLNIFDTILKETLLFRTVALPILRVTS